MNTQDFTRTVHVPTETDFAELFPHYAKHASGEYGPLFKALTAVHVINDAIVVTDALRMPAVAGVAETAFATAHAHGIAWRSHVKQFVGGVIRVVMEANGYRKTEAKRAIPHKGFTKGEVYERHGAKDEVGAPGRLNSTDQ